MKPWTVEGAWLVTVTLTLLSLCSSALGAERELVASLSRLERQVGNQEAVVRRSRSPQSNVRFATRPESSDSVVQQQGAQVTSLQANQNSRQHASATASQPVRQGGQVARSQVNPNSGQPSRSSASRSQTNTNTQRQLLDYPHDLPLTQMTAEMLDNFLASEEDVTILTNCFESFSTCRSKHGINLIRQLRELGIGGQCKECTPEEQKRLDELIYQFIQKFIARYPKHWRRIVPNIGKFLVPKRPDA